MAADEGERRSKPNRSEAVAFWAVIAVALVAGIAPLITPSETRSSEIAVFSVERAMEHVAEIARSPHPIGTGTNARVRSYLVDELTALGLEPELQSVTVQDYFGDPDNTVEVVNVMARISGEVSRTAVALMAHYDSVPTTYGANDNAAAVAAILETARLLVDGPPLRNDVIVLFTDGEEPAPRFGSSAFLDRHPWASDVGFVVNFEAIGGSGPSMVIETSGPEAWVVEGLRSDPAHPVAFSFLPAIVDLIGEVGTDFDPFVSGGTPGIHLAYLRGSPIYHTFRDSFDRVSDSSLAHHGSYAVALAGYFGSVDLDLLPTSENRTYFTIGRWWLVSYPDAVAVPLAMLSVALFGVSLVRRVGGGESSLRGLVRGVAVVLLRLLVAVLVTTLLWKALTGLRRSPGVVESYLYLGGLLALCGGIGLATFREARRPGTDRDTPGGLVLIWVALAVAAAWLLPRASYLFVWPAIAGSLALIVAPLSRYSRVAVLALVSIPSAVVVLPAIETFFQMAMPRPGNPDSEIVETIAASLMLAVLTAGLVNAMFARQRSSKTVMTPE